MTSSLASFLLSSSSISPKLSANLSFFGGSDVNGPLLSNCSNHALRSGVDVMVYPSMFTFMDWTLLFPLFINIALYLS